MKKVLKNIINFTGSSLKKIYELFAGREEALPPSGIRSILIVCLHHLGDFLFATPAIKAIREHYPKAHIAVWIKSRTAGIVKESGLVDEVIVFDEVCTDRTREKGGSWAKKREFAGKLKQRDFDLLVDLSGVFDSILVGILSGIKKRFGFSTQGLGFLFTRETRLPTAKHLVERYNAVAGSLGIKVTDSRLQMKLNKENFPAVDNFLKESGIKPAEHFICIHPGAGWKTKTWPPEKFAELADRVLTEMKVKVVICGGVKEVPCAKKIAEGMRAEPVIAAGKFSLGELAVLMSRCALYVGHDSGPTYIAESLLCPLIVLFGPTNPLYSAPRTKNSVMIRNKLSCSPGENMQNCHDLADYPCRGVKCMESIEVDHVFREIERMLNANRN